MHQIGTKYYRHDCKECTWLASIRLGPMANCYDLYFCVQTPLNPTVIARHGHSPPEYASGMAIAEQLPLTDQGTHKDALRIAWLIARDLAYGANAGSLKRPQSITPGRTPVDMRPLITTPRKGTRE